MIVGTVSVYGLLAGPLARRLGLADPNPQGILFAGAEKWVREIAKVLHEEGYSVMLVDTNYANVAEAQMDRLASRLLEHPLGTCARRTRPERDWANAGHHVQ